MIRRLLCKIGLHGYRVVNRLVGFRGLMLGDWLEECDTCGKGRLWISDGEAVEYYSPDEMQAIRAHRTQYQLAEKKS